MEKTLQAVYKGGVLQPLEPLPLEEMQQVTVTISDSSPLGPPLGEDMAGYFTLEEWAAAANDRIGWEEVRQAFSKVSGSLSDAVIAQRQER